MMNVLALGLVLTSLVTAGFFSPSSVKESPEEAVIVKEGHRVVVVEYEKDDGNTKVSILPKDEEGYDNGAKDKLSAKERAEEASCYAGDQVEEMHNEFSPTELVCDAYGKCKRLIAGATGKTKEVEEDAKGAVGEAVGKVKDTAFDKVQEAKENVKDSANEVKDKFSEKTSKIKERVEDAAEATKKKKEEVKRDAKIKMEGNKEKVLGKAREAEEWVEKEGQKTQKEVSEILRRGYGIVGYTVSPERVAPWTGVVHLLGFAVAYGMCVWVTFASSYVLAGALPRQQFGMAQSKIYPVYFKGMAYGVGMALWGHLVSSRKPIVGLVQGLNLAAALVMTFVNLLWLEPRATKVMFERMKKEKEEGRKAVDKDSRAEIAGRVEIGAQVAEINGLTATLQRLNSYSSFLNVLTLMSLTWHLVHLGQFLHVGV